MVCSTRRLALPTDHINFASIVMEHSFVMIQLNPPLPLESSRGSGVAHFIIDYGPESDLLWVVFLDADGSCWAIPNPEIRMRANWSLGRRGGRPNGGDHPEPNLDRPDGTALAGRAGRI